MRLAYLHSGSIPSVYANGVHVMRMCDAFTDAGHDVTLYALPGTAPADDLYAYYGTRNRFPVRTVAGPSARRSHPWLRALRIRHALRRGTPPDLLYGRDLHALAASVSLAPTVYETHLLWDDRRTRAVERRLFGHPNLRRVVFVSQALAEDYRRAFPALRAADGPELVAAADCADPPPDGPAATLPGRPDATSVGYVGHLYPGRGTDLILRVAELLPEVDFHLVGGTAEDLAHWRARPRTPNVYFHGHQPPARLHPYYRAFDIVLAPYQQRVACCGGVGDISRWVSPMKFFEYMAHGKAIVSSDLPVLREVLADEVTGVLCPCDDVEAWVRAVRDLAADPARRARLGGAARRLARDEYTWRARVDRVLPALAPVDGGGR